MINYFNLILDQNDEKVLNTKLAFLTDNPKDSKDYALILKKGNDSIRKYPINTSENVAYSYVSFEKNSEKLTPEMFKIASSNLAKAMDFYKMSHNLTKDATVTNNVYVIQPKDEHVYTPVEKTAFAIDAEGIKRLPIDTPTDLESSIKLFKKDIYKLPPEIKKTASQNFVKRAEELGITIAPEINKYASEQLIDKSEMRTMMSSRLQYYPENVKTVALDMLDHIKNANDALEYIKFAENADAILNLNKVNHPDLSAEFFSIKQDKTAEFYKDLESAIDNSVLNDYLDEEVVGLLKDNPGNFDHLNPNLKQTIKTIINGTQK